MSRAELRVVPLVASSAVGARVEVDPVGPSWGALLVAYADELRARDSTPQALSGRLAHVRRLSREVGGSPASVTLGDLERFLTRPE